MELIGVMQEFRLEAMHPSTMSSSQDKEDRIALSVLEEVLEWTASPQSRDENGDFMCVCTFRYCPPTDLRNLADARSITTSRGSRRNCAKQTKMFTWTPRQSS